MRELSSFIYGEHVWTKRVAALPAHNIVSEAIVHADICLDNKGVSLAGETSNHRVLLFAYQSLVKTQKPPGAEQPVESQKLTRLFT